MQGNIQQKFNSILSDVFKFRNVYRPSLNLSPISTDFKGCWIILMNINYLFVIGLRTMCASIYLFVRYKNDVIFEEFNIVLCIFGIFNL